MIVPKVGFHRGDVCGQRMGRGVRDRALCQTLCLSKLIGTEFLSKEIAHFLLSVTVIQTV